jgi:hypothetical protein
VATTLVEPADQPVNAPYVNAAGNVTDATAQVEQPNLPAGSVALYTFSQEWTVPYNGGLITFRPGVGYQLDAVLLAYLTAQSITATAV